MHLECELCVSLASPPRRLSPLLHLVCPQVVDLEWELQRRGLSALQAAQLLDAGLSLRLRVHMGCRWVSVWASVWGGGGEVVLQSRSGVGNWGGAGTTGARGVQVG